MIDAAVKAGSQHATVLALWNTEWGGPGGPSDLIERTRAMGVEIVVLDTRRIFEVEAAVAQEAAATVSMPAEGADIPTVPTIRIFLSGPSDVTQDLTQLLDFLEHPSLTAGRAEISVIKPVASPFESITSPLPLTPTECDLAIFLMWNLFGAPISNRKPDGTQYGSALEWEFEAAARRGMPVLLYRRAEEVRFNPSDTDFNERVAQRKSLDDFLQRIQTQRAGDFHKTVETYTNAEDLLRRVQFYMTGFVKDFLSRPRRTRVAPP